MKNAASPTSAPTSAPTSTPTATPTATPTSVPTATPTVGAFKLSRTVLFSTFTTTQYTGDLRQTLEAGFGIALGIYDKSQVTFKTGCTVSSSALTRRAATTATVAFEATMRYLTLAQQSAATAAANALTSDSFLIAVEEAKQLLVTSIDVPVAATITVVPLPVDVETSSTVSTAIFVVMGVMLFLTAVAGFVPGSSELTCFQRLRPLFAEIDLGSDLIFIQHVHSVNPYFFWTSAGFLLLSALLNGIFVNYAISKSLEKDLLDRDALQGSLSGLYVTILVLAITKPDVIVLLPFKEGCRGFLGLPDEDLLTGLNVGLLEDCAQIVVAGVYMSVYGADLVALFQLGTSTFFVLFSYFERKVAGSRRVAPTTPNEVDTNRVVQALQKPALERTLSDKELLQQISGDTGTEPA